ncbi:acyl-CoA dehydrogenase family protein [Aquamicrobium sp.]|uniref:acyl-CoA dehydrogenase family protein n=1 Tax=Aquamicrobium sp. TaxID=1872579 RepID=UPI0025889608|nr:acyl-CoA dehydrogenase family protein [Aquamicrobium sp.]MCK9552374.1 acyl-CoA dehydrogenase family protein [Aquamicrobium sp.]
MFDYTERTAGLRQRLLAFMDEHIYPNEAALLAHEHGPERWQTAPLIEKLKEKAKQQGLWNLFLPESELGAGLSNLDYAHLCEIMGRSPFAPEVFNCAAPDTGNMEVLARYGTEEQKQRWLLPLLEGEIRSCFSMTEPAVASSDATNIECSIRRDGDDYVINGRKWWSSGAMDPRCRIAIVMGKTDPSEKRHRQQSMILVPLDTPGVKIERALTVFGYDHAPHGHAEISYDNVRVPASNILLGEGRGFEIAQGRLGPGRIHHCMRTIGIAERALETMVERARSRTAFGRTLLEMGSVREQIAQSRIEIEQTRLLTLRAADMMDRAGNKVARLEIAMIKAVAPAMACRVIDRAIQVHGAAGVSQDTFLASAYARVRSLRLADGPDEVHLETIAKLEIGKNAERAA